MNLLGKIKQRIFRSYFKIGSCIHVRHWRGHGIHSPFMYGIVRNVFMKTRITGKERELYGILVREGVSRKNSIKLQNLYTHCKMDSYTVVPTFSGRDGTGRNLCILLPCVSMETLVDMARGMARKRKGCLVVLSPHRNGRCWRLSQQIRRHYSCVSVDRRLMMIYFFDTGLQPQHYRI